MDVAAEVRHETRDAYLIFDGAKEVWLPKSLVEYDDRDKVVTLPEWKAKMEGLI